MSNRADEQSADMRVLELQRTALGLPPRVMISTSYNEYGAVIEAPRAERPAEVRSGTFLVAAMDARPQAALIPGALVTVSLSVVNQGDVPASGVRVNLPLPVDTAYHPATLAIDGARASDDVANELFANGAELGEIQPGATRSIAVKLLVAAGTDDIILAPDLSAESTAVTGLRSMRLTRRAGTIQGIIERPFYESDDAEHAEEPLAPAPPQPLVDVLQPRELPSELQAASFIQPKAMPTSPTPKGQTEHKRKSEAKPRARPKPKVHEVPTEVVASPIPRPKIEVVRSIDDRISLSGQGGPVLAVRINRKRLATLTGLFGGASLGMIAHYLLLNALAVREPLPDDGTDGAIATFVANQEHLLSRALIATRLGKTPASESVSAALPTFPGAHATHADRLPIELPPPGEAMLFRAFEENQVTFVRRTLSDSKATPFMRAAQLFVSLCANDAVIGNVQERRNIGVKLTNYASMATAEIGRIFLRAKLYDAPAFFNATETAFDDSAKAVLAALAHSIA